MEETGTGITAEGALLEGTLFEDEGFVLAGEVRAGLVLTDAGEVRTGSTLTVAGAERAGTVSCAGCTAGTEGRLLFSGAETEMTGLGVSVTGVRMLSSSFFCADFFSTSFSMSISISLSVIAGGVFFNLECTEIIASEMAAEKTVITPTSKNARIASEITVFPRFADFLAVPVRFLREFGFFVVLSLFFMPAFLLSAILTYYLYELVGISLSKNVF